MEEIIVVIGIGIGFGMIGIGIGIIVGYHWCRTFDDRMFNNIKKFITEVK